jgi:ankyrin repeat protein
MRRRTIIACAMLLGFAVIVTEAFAMSEEDTMLIAAAERGDNARVEELLAKGADVQARDNFMRTALLAATQGNHVAVATRLIEAGADVNAQDRQRDSAFLLAGARGYLEILRSTLAHGADLASTNRYGGTALIPACERGHVETVRELLSTSIDVNHVNNLGWTALMEAVVLSDGGPVHQEIVRLLLKDGRANPNLPDKDGVTPLQHARRRGYTAIAGLLQDAGGQ